MAESKRPRKKANASTNKKTNKTDKKKSPKPEVKKPKPWWKSLFSCTSDAIDDVEEADDVEDSEEEEDEEEEHAPPSPPSMPANRKQRSLRQSFDMDGEDDVSVSSRRSGRSVRSQRSMHMQSAPVIMSPHGPPYSQGYVPYVPPPRDFDTMSQCSDTRSVGSVRSHRSTASRSSVARSGYSYGGGHHTPGGYGRTQSLPMMGPAYPNHQQVWSPPAQTMLLGIGMPTYDAGVAPPMYPDHPQPQLNHGPHVLSRHQSAPAVYGHDNTMYGLSSPSNDSLHSRPSSMYHNGAPQVGYSQPPPPQPASRNQYHNQYSTPPPAAYQPSQSIAPSAMDRPVTVIATASTAPVRPSERLPVAAPVTINSSNSGSSNTMSNSSHRNNNSHSSSNNNSTADTDAALEIAIMLSMEEHNQRQQARESAERDAVHHGVQRSLQDTGRSSSARVEHVRPSRPKVNTIQQQQQQSSSREFGSIYEF